jgi:hypothetical protein
MRNRQVQDTRASSVGHPRHVEVFLHDHAYILLQERRLLLQVGEATMKCSWSLRAAQHPKEERDAQKNAALCADMMKVRVRKYQLKLGIDYYSLRHRRDFSSRCRSRLRRMLSAMYTWRLSWGSAMLSTWGNSAAPRMP